LGQRGHELSDGMTSLRVIRSSALSGVLKGKRDPVRVPRHLMAGWLRREEVLEVTAYGWPYQDWAAAISGQSTATGSYDPSVVTIRSKMIDLRFYAAPLPSHSSVLQAEYNLVAQITQYHDVVI